MTAQNCKTVLCSGQKAGEFCNIAAKGASACVGGNVHVPSRNMWQLHICKETCRMWHLHICKENVAYGQGTVHESKASCLTLQSLHVGSITPQNRQS